MNKDMIITDELFFDVTKKNDRMLARELPNRIYNIRQKSEMTLLNLKRYFEKVPEAIFVSYVYLFKINSENGQSVSELKERCIKWSEENKPIFGDLNEDNRKMIEFALEEK